MRRLALCAGVGIALAAASLVVGACVTENPGIDVRSNDAGANDAGASPDGSPADGAAANCTAPKTSCGDACVDTTSDSANCGTCGTSCGSGVACFEGVCNGAKITRLAAGDTFACALRASGSVWCWGANNVAQLGARRVPEEVTCDGKACSPTPVRVDGLENIASIEAGYGTACAISQTGEAFCWGRVASKQLGELPSELCDGPCIPKPTRLPFQEPLAQISLGLNSSCARTLSKDVYCFGNNGYGQLGTGLTDGGVPEAPTKVVLPGGADSLGVGSGPNTHACALVGTTVYCWGSNGAQQIRAPGASPPTCVSGTCVPAPVAISGLGGGVQQVIVGDGHTCVRIGTKVRCWGYSGYGVAGGSAAPVEIPLLEGAAEISGKGEHVCGRLSDGRVLCFGLSLEARLGVVDTNVSSPACSQGPCKPPNLVPELDAIAIAAFAPSLAIRSDGSVVAWGPSRRGTLGHLAGTNGDVTCPHTSPTSVPCNPSPQAIPNLP